MQPCLGVVCLGAHEILRSKDRAATIHRAGATVGLGGGAEGHMEARALQELQLISAKWSHWLIFGS